MKIKILREYFSDGTNGDMFVDEKPFHHTIELPWKNNEHGISCVPEGTYELVKHHSDHLGDVMLLVNVPNRDLCYIHKANNALKELKGCTAPVMTLTGHGIGSDSHDVFDPILKMVYAEIDKGNKVTVTYLKK